MTVEHFEIEEVFYLKSLKHGKNDLYVLYFSNYAMQLARAKGYVLFLET